MKPPRRQPGMLALAGAVLALMVVMLLALRGRGWVEHWFHPHPAEVALAAGPADTESARFALCRGPYRVTCVVDGDTIWYRHHKIRLADINAPEVSEPQCDAELDLGEKATDRLIVLLNAGPFSLVPLPDRDEDVYGRKLRTITRGGKSLGGVLVAEGLAERWVGYRRDWCR